MIPHSEQDAMSPSALENAYEWYTSGPRQRLQPGGKIVLVMTRWSTKDLTAMLLKNQKEVKGDQWEVIEFPAIMDARSSGLARILESGRIRQGKSNITGAKVECTVDAASNFSEEGAIIKREWWRKWTSDRIPPLRHVIQSYDTAFLKSETADYSAITTWGIFFPSEDKGAQLLLLDAVKDRYEFPELRRKALQLYKYWEPETVLD